MSTPHIYADPDDFAETVIMPGDPNRARKIADLLLTQTKCVTNVRGILGFTGIHDGKKLSVMASGMGMPSATIYAILLKRDYDVQKVVRVGTCGAISRELEIGDVVIASAAHTDSEMNEYRIPGIHFSASASFDLLQAAAKEVADNSKVHIGSIVSRDHFYLTPEAQTEALATYGVLGVDMETAAIYAVAAEFRRKALTILTVSDHLLKKTHNMTAGERENNFQNALCLAVKAAEA